MYSDLADRLEGILRRFLNCHYTEFGVKANNLLLKYDFKSPINFALGVLYGKKPELKQEINNFISNRLVGGNSIESFIDEYENKEAGIKEVESILDELEKLLMV